MWEMFGLRALSTVVYGGGDLGEIATTIERVGDGGPDAWHREWVATGERVAAIADEASAHGKPVSAREAYFRAVTYLSTSYLPLLGAPTDPLVKGANARQNDLFARAAALADPPIEVVEIPYEHGTLPGYFAVADGSGEPRATVVYTNGYDSNIQEMYFAHADAATSRVVGVRGSVSEMGAPRLC